MHLRKKKIIFYLFSSPHHILNTVFFFLPFFSFIAKICTSFNAARENLYGWRFFPPFCKVFQFFFLSNSNLEIFSALE